MKALFIIFLREMYIYTQHYSFWKPDQPAGHAELVLDYSPSGKQHVWFISETFQKAKRVPCVIACQ